MVDATRVKARGAARRLGVRLRLRVTLWLAGVVVVLLGVAPTVAQATESKSRYDVAGQHHNNVCAKLRPERSLIDLRYVSGAPTGFQLPNTLTFMPNDSAHCLTGQIRLDLHEVVDSNAGLLVFHRGGNGYGPTYDDAANVRYGQVAESEVSDASGQPLPNQAQLQDPNPPPDGNGDPCRRVLNTPYRVSVRPIPPDMKYKSPQAVAGGDNAGASYLHYGDPAAQQGDQDPQKYSTDLTKEIHYSTLTWSWIDVAGGGHNRILLAPAQDIRLCDVKPIRRDSWAPSSVAPDGQVNGWVTARYVQTRVGNGPALYGWMVWQHHWGGDGNNPDGTPVVVNHFTTS
jgi:hypothetical protein